MNLKRLKGLYVRGVTSYPAYIKGKLVAFNLCKFPRNATDKTVLVQFPTPFATIRFEYPREGAPRALKRQGHHMSKSRGMPLNLVRFPYKWINPNINEMQSWASHSFGLTSSKSSSPTTRSGSRILRGYCGPKAQAEETYCRGRVMKALKRPKDVAEDNLMLSIPQDT